jgi:Holliday junction resolvasome RuvABC endonuclease subunit
VKYVLTYDPSITAAGIAVFQEDGELVFYETIKFDKKTSQAERLYSSLCVIDATLAMYPGKFRLVFSEKQFMPIMMQMEGVVKAAAGKHKLPVETVTPSSWKKSAFKKGNITEDNLKVEVIKRYPQLVNESEHVLDCAGMFIAWENDYKVKEKERVKNVQAPKANRRRKNVL